MKPEKEIGQQRVYIIGKRDVPDLYSKHKSLSFFDRLYIQVASPTPILGIFEAL
jgi:hypothetical protein